MTCGNRACHHLIAADENVVVAAELSEATRPGDLVRTYLEGEPDVFHAGHVPYGWREKRRGQLRDLQTPAART